MAEPSDAPDAPVAPAEPPPSSGLLNSLKLASLYVGDLHPDCGEATLYEAFSEAGNVASCRVCRDNVTRKSLGYGYVNYYSVQDAERALETLNYMSIKGKTCRVMWSQKDPERRRNNANNIFVKGLDETIDNKALHDTFSIFGNILSCKVATSNDGKSRGYGFVHYEAEEAAQQAIARVNGMRIGNSTVFVGPFLKREDMDAADDFTNLYVKNMPPAWDDAKVSAIFAEFGEVTSSLVQTTDTGKRFALVNFKTSTAAKAAVANLHRRDMRAEALQAEVPESAASQGAEGKTGEEQAGEKADEAAAREKEAAEGEAPASPKGAEEEEEFPAHLLYVQRAQSRAERKAQLEEDRKKRSKDKSGKGSGKDGKPGVKICIRNLVEGITSDKLKELFEPFGTVIAVITRENQDPSKKAWTHAFVVMSTMEEATAAIEKLNGQELEGQAMNVLLSERNKKRGDGEDGGKGDEKGRRGKGKGKGGKGKMPGPVLGQSFPVRPGFAPPAMPGLGVRPPMPGLPYGLPLHPGLPGPGHPGAYALHPAAAAASRCPVGPLPYAARPPFPQGLPAGFPGVLPFFHGLPRPPMGPPIAAALVPPPALTREVLERMPPQQQKQVLGERLFPACQRFQPNLGGKLTGMILELPSAQILELLENEEKLKQKIQEGIKVLQSRK